MVVVTIGGLISIVFFPEPLFANQIKRGPFNVYSNSKIDTRIEAVLDSALHLVQKSELYQRDYTFDVFLCHNTLFNKIDDRLLGYGPSARATDNNITIKVAIDPGRNLFFPTYYQQCEGNLTYLIAHEMIHCLQENKYGKTTFNPFLPPPIWKLEGYPEYIVRQPRLSAESYYLTEEINRYMDLEAQSTDLFMAIEEGGCKVPRYYYKSRLMTEYLMNVHHLSYNQLLNDTTSEEHIYAAMLKWSKETNPPQHP